MSRCFVLVLAAGLSSAVQATPGTAARPFDFFLGRWDCAGHFASGKPIASHMRYAADLAGTALVKHHEGAPPGSYRAIESWSVAPHAGALAMVVLDNVGGAHRFTSAGWHGPSLTWLGDGQVRPAQRFVYTRLDERRYRVDWDVARDGKAFATGDTLTCVRSG